MKSHRTILIVSIISLTLLVAAAGTYFPSSLTQRTSAQKGTLKVTPAARVRSRLQNSKRVIPYGHALPFLPASDDLGEPPDSEKLAAELFVDPPAPLGRTTLTAPSPATFEATPNNDKRQAHQGGTQEGNLQSNDQNVQARGEGDKAERKPKEERLTKAHPFNGDLRDLPYRKPVKRERPELGEPEPNPTFAPGTPATAPSTPQIAGPSAPAPAPLNVFDGLDRFNWGAGSPPDTNGDVGPNYYIQTVNTSIGVYRKSDGFREAAFTFDTFMSQGSFGNLCDTNNFGDPVVLYDTFEDRWIISDFAFVLDGSGNVLAPAFQCIAASKSGDPVTGGWNFYSTQISDNLNDYPKFGIWPDGLYMSANLFSFGAGSTFKTARAWAFNKAQMYAGSPTVKVVSFDIPGGDFAVMPSNARLQTGTPPPGRPNLFISSWQFLNALTVYKFHVDWNSISLSTFTGPDVPLAATSWPNAAVANAAQPGTAMLLDVLQIRAMVQNQYTNFGGTESLWVPHTVRRANTSGFASPRWYQANVTGGTVAANLVQATTWDPDGANVINRFMPSLALDRAGNMAMGYSTSSGTVFPSIMYAGRLAADPINTFSKTEQTFFTGTASQTGINRWGDYSAMTLDPDGCTFWYTTEYANPADQTFNHRWLTKFGSFRYSECTQLGAGGTISGTVTTNPGGSSIVGATVELGARSTTTDGFGIYSFNSIPAGTYPSMTASFPGSVSASALSIVVTDGGTTTQDFSLAAAATSACLTDTTQSDFLTGVASASLDLNTSPGDVTLSNAPAVDQSNTAGTTTGTGFGTPNWTGQTFIPAVTGLLAKADVQLFCNGCGATPPNLTLSVRNTSGGLPTGADLASVTIPGSAFSSGSTVTYTASFGSPATLTSGTQYVLVLHPVTAPAGSGYFWIRSSPSTYANGQRVLSSDSGATWSADSTRDFNFKAYMQVGYAASGNLISSPRDANPAGGLTPIWSTFSWNAAVPANTSVKFQLAGSNNVNGPFNFVGPDGTAATFFTTSPVQLSPQFYNLRFVEYKALLATTDGTVTPTLSDATACFNDVDCSTTVATITPAPAQVCANSTGNTASGPAGMTAYAWGITNGTITSATNTQSITYTAGASGTVTLGLTVTGPNGCIVANSAPVTINPIPATPTITPGGPTTFCAGGSVSLTSSNASGNQWFLNGNPIGGATSQVYVATASGNYSVITTASSCASAASAATTVTVNPLPTTPTITPGGPTTFCPGGSVLLTSSSAAGNQWYLNGNPIGGATNQMYSATASGNYTDVVTASGCASAPSAATTVTVNPIPAPPTITPGGPTTFCAGGSVALTSSSASGNQWYLNGNPIGGATNQAYSATASGNYTDIVTTNGCPSSPSAATSVTVNPIPATPTITPGGPTTFCAGGSVALTSSSASGNQWYLNGNPIGGATNQTYSATASGNYTDVVMTNGCNSAPSTATTVTVNPIPATPTITPGGPTTFSTGGSVTLTSSSASGNQWLLNGNPIAGATNQSYVATASGDYTVRHTALGCTSAPSATVTVVVIPFFPPTISKLFLPDTVAPDGTTLLSFTISNPNSDPNTNVTLTGITFTDNLPAGLVIASPNELSNDCGGTVTATPGSSSISLSDGTLAPAAPDTLRTGQSLLAFYLPSKTQASANPAQGTCFISLKVKAPSALGTLNNTTGPIASNESGPGAASNTATLTVTAPTLPPTIAKAFGAASIPLNGTTSLTFVFTNPNSDVLLMNVSASDTLPTGLVVANPDSLAGNCAADINANPGGNTIGITALNLAASSSCSFSVNVTGTSAGIWNNTSGNVTATYDDGTGTFVPIIGGTATATIQVLKGNQTITFGALPNKTFGDADFSVSATSPSGLSVSLTATGNCTVTNPSPGTVHLTSAGSCTITASQAGDGNYNAATNVAQSFNVAQAATTTALSSSINPSNLTQTLTFTATVTGPASTGAPTGTVQFTIDGSNTGAPVALNGSGVATLSTSSLTAGTHTVTAEYSGDMNFAASTGALSGGQSVNNRPLIGLSQTSYAVNESTGFVTITVNRAGDLSVMVNVDYATDDTGSSNVCGTLNSGLASSRCDFGMTLGTLKFAATETQKTFIVPITQDSYTEGPEMFTVNLTNLTGTAVFVTPSNATVTINDSAAPAPNASDDTDAFVRQQYRDFLNREADPAGLAFWTNEITSCGSDTACRDLKRIYVSAAFFLSIEFQQSGVLVRSFYVATLDRPLTDNMPAFVEFEHDTQAVQRGVVVGQGNWQQTLNDNRDAFMKDFVTRAEFVGLYPLTDTPAQYVDKLYLHAGITPASNERANAIAEFGSATTAADAGSRGRALLDVTQNAAFQQREMNRSFVQMEYFGYLRRNPNDAPDGDFVGYNFWVAKLNQFNGNFVNAEMVKAFITSDEYRRRFGP